MVDVNVSIVNWNTSDELRDCLLSVLGQGSETTIDVTVVDNASTDGSLDMLKSEFKDTVKLIENSKNVGFGAAHNQILTTTDGRYVFILNPDSELIENDVVYSMVKYMDDNPDIGVLGPKIINPDGSLQFSARHFPTIFAGIFRQTVFGKLFPNNRFVKAYLMTDCEHDRIMDVDWLSGSALMVKRDVLDKIGYFDERFFMYCEDVDICHRAHLGGYRVVYFPETCITHRIGAASDQNPIPMIKQHHRSMLRYYFKYNSKSLKVLLIPLVAMGLWLRERSLIKRATRKI